MNQPFIEKVPDVVVIKAVKGILTFAPHSNQPEISQDSELMGYKRGGCIKQCRKITHTKFLFGQELNYIKTGRITKHLESLSKFMQGFLRQQHVAQRLNLIFAQVLYLAGIINHN
jgi:hypothetical protein